MSVTERDTIARHAALLQLAAAHDHWSTEEQLAVERGQYIEAEGCHAYALAVLRAYKAELDDPQPERKA